jgi:hypothetical protein
VLGVVKFEKKDEKNNFFKWASLNQKRKSQKPNYVNMCGYHKDRNQQKINGHPNMYIPDIVVMGVGFIIVWLYL